MCRRTVCFTLLAAYACAPGIGANPRVIAPLGVCEVLRNLSAMDGKDEAVVGRYSFRADGRWLSEQVCDSSGPAPATLWLVEDTKDAPKPPEEFEIDGAVLHRKLAEISRRTSLGKFRFGTPDYDRWAVIYGRVETRKGDEAKKAPANLLFRGSGAVVFVTE